MSTVTLFFVGQDLWYYLPLLWPGMLSMTAAGYPSDGVAMFAIWGRCCNDSKALRPCTKFYHIELLYSHYIVGGKTGRKDGEAVGNKTMMAS